MHKKKTWSVLLSLIVTLTVCFAFGGMVMADPEQPAYDFSNLPYVNYSIAYDPLNITHSGYTDLSCYFDDLTYGKVTDNLISGDLEITFARSGVITNANGETVANFEVTNAAHNLAASSSLKFKFNERDNQILGERFYIAIKINNSDFCNLSADDTYNAVISYSGTWQNVVDITDFSNAPDAAGPDKTIQVPITISSTLEEYGDFGNGLHWKLDREGTLTISGDGSYHNNNEMDMPDYSSPLDTPWYSCHKHIKSIVVEFGVTKIGSYAFSNCDSATSLSLPYYGVTVIGERAFNNCGFTSVSIPYGITTIGDGAFYSCDKLTSITLQSSIKTIGKFAFGYCAFESIIIPYQVTEISESTFVNCTDLKSVTIEGDVTSIGSSAFSLCSSLTDIDIPDTVTSIGVGAFSLCSKLRSITIPNGVTIIPTQTFYGCSDLESVTLSFNTASIAYGAFMGCRSLETIKLPNKVTSIEAMAFFGCNSLDSVYCMADPDILTWGASDNDFKPDKGTTCYVAGKYKSTYESKFSNVNVAFDSYVIGQGTCGDDLTWIIDGDGTLTVSGTGAMYDFDYDTQPWAPYKEDILRVIIEDGATSIGSYAFYGYNNLSFVGMNDSVTSIGYNAFGETADLKNIALSAGLQTIGYGAFYKSGIESILIPASVTSIGNYTFEFSGLKTVTFESGSRLTELNKTLFHGCSQLESVTLPDSLEIIGEEAFRECAALKTITIPGTVSTIKKQAFYNCTGLESVIFEDGVGEICEKAFSFCMNIKSLTIPGSVVFKGKEAFSHCLGLESLTICDGITTIPNSTFFNCRHLVSISLADSVTAIGNDAFSVYYDAYAHSYDSLYGALETIVLPSNLTDLGSYALCGQGLRTITIPGSVRVVSDNLYEGCIYLNTITLLKGITSITNYAGFNCNAVTSASVPSTVTYIGKYAFGSGDSMEDLYLYPDPANLSSFYYYESTDTDNDKGNINSNTKIHVLNQYLEAYRTKYQDIAGQFVGDLDPNGEGTINTGTGVHLYGYNLSLSGDVSVNFWFKLSDGYEDDTNYIKFTVNGREQIVTVGEADDGTGGAKVFRCGVTAVEMTDKITAQFYLADGTAVGSSYSYTVRDYANYILTHDSYSAKAKNLVKAMLNYGACSQKYFNYNTNALANSVLDAADQQVPILNYTDLMYKDIPSRSIRPALVSLVLESEISLKLYFNTADVEGMEFKQYFYPITVTTQGSYTVVTIQNISALWINSGVRVDVWKDGAYYDYVEYCPGKYCKLILKQPTSEVYNEDLKRVVSALCIYHSAAMDFAQA